MREKCVGVEEGGSTKMSPIDKIRSFDMRKISIYPFQTDLKLDCSLEDIGTTELAVDFSSYQ